MASPEEIPKRRDADLRLAPGSQRPVREDVFEKVESVTGVVLTPGMVPNAHAQAAFSALLDELERAEKARDTDALTGVFNRGVFDRIMKQELSLRNDTGTNGRQTYEHPPLTVALFDINDFKKVNTEHTHAGGDHAIKHVGRILDAHIKGENSEKMAKLKEDQEAIDKIRRNLRSTDMVTRLGGDEFAIIMYDTKDTPALRIRLESMRKRIIGEPCEFNDKTINLDVSYGIHELAKDDTIESIVADISAKMSVDKKRTKGENGTGQTGQGGGMKL